MIRANATATSKRTRRQATTHLAYAGSNRELSPHGAILLGSSTCQRQPDRGYFMNRQAFFVAGGATDGGNAVVLGDYHSRLVPTFCLAAVKSFFDGQGG